MVQCIGGGKRHLGYLAANPNLSQYWPLRLKLDGLMMFDDV